MRGKGKSQSSFSLVKLEKGDQRCVAANQTFVMSERIFIGAARGTRPATGLFQRYFHGEPIMPAGHAYSKHKPILVVEWLWSGLGG